MKAIINKVFLTCTIIFSAYSFVYAQEFNNHWINYDQQYFRVAVHSDGFYKLTYSEMLSAGIPVNSIDPRNIQLFYQGEEQYIHLESGSLPGIFDPNGYLLFYGKRNRGDLDIMFFDNPENQVNPDYSFYNDTSSYFITWNNQTNNRRFEVIEDNDYNPYIPNAQNYCLKRVRTNYTGSWYQGSSRAIFSKGTGFFDNSVITENNSRTKTIQTPNIYNSNVQTEIELAVAGVPASSVISTVPHHLEVSVNGSNMIDEIYYGYDFVRKQLNISSINIASSISFVFSSNDTQQPNITDRNAVSYIDIRYPHTWNFGNNSYYEFYIKANSQASKDFIEINNFNHTGGVDIFDLSNNKKIIPTISNNRVRVLIPNAQAERKLAVINKGNYKSVDGIYSIGGNNRFIDYHSENHNSDYLIITHKSLLDGANQYANYRNSTGFNSQVIDINQLYYQFAYGVNKHPGAIREFVEYSYSLSARPKYLFLLGKSIHLNSFRRNSTHFANCLVPSAGYPASDNLLTAGLYETIYEPLYPTGRLSSRNNQMVLDYLNKVIEHESNPPAAWMKNIVHFGGGMNANEQATFASYLDSYKTIIEDTLFGGLVSSFFKTSSDPIQITQSDSVRNLINGGASMLTFFGHAMATGFDQSIDNPENYNNKGKYPFLLANSCFSGDIHLTTSYSVSERWVNIADKGTIGFLASVGAGLAPYLHIFSTELYKNITYKSYNRSIGAQIINAIKDAQELYQDSFSLELTFHEFTLHGDPAVKINSHDLPDLLLEPQGVRFIPQEITTSIDSFDVELTIKNIGRATVDTFLVTATRTLPNGISETYDKVVVGCNYIKKIYFRFPVSRLEGPGMNSLRFYADALNEIEELDETNNEVTVNFLIRSGDINPIYPYNYAIYPNSSVSLIASTIEPFIGYNEYLFRIDTTDYFNSLGGAPIAQGSVYSEGGVVSWDVPFELSENVVYYWQVAEAHNNHDSIVWKESSFIYISEEEGWSQAHFYQFKNNFYRFIDYQKEDRSFEFITTPKELHCHNTGNFWSGTWSFIRWSIDGAIGNGQGDSGGMGTDAAMMVVVIDSVTLTAWASNRANYGHRNYPQSPFSPRENYFYMFDATETGFERMNAMLDTAIPEGHYMLTYSWNNGRFEQWPESLRQTFDNMGATKHRDAPNGHAYIFFTQYGTPNTTEEWELLGETSNAAIDLYVTLETDFNYGEIHSVKVGPSSNWKSLHWDFNPNQYPEHDEVNLSVYGINNQGNEDLLIESISPGDWDIYYLEDSINYLQYPNLKLNFFTRNDSAKKPAQLTKWQLKFDPVAETAIDPSGGFVFCCDTIAEGEEIVFGVATRNVSSVNMDSLRVKYWLLDNNNNKTLIDLKTLRPHPAGDVIIDTITYSSIGLNGLNSIWVQYNPINSETGNYYQMEQYHFNNIATKHFFVQRDITNPLLDVSFDGKHIMDGDLVSARPEILIQLKDENKFLALNDTSLFRIYITDMQSGEESRIYFDHRDHPEESLLWIPAVLPNNSCQIIYKPVFENDGMYQLRVQATDVSQNESGKNDYVIRFEVINESTITHLLNYPNPFSTSTRFVFELTGDKVPDDLRIDIFTVTGKLVKVIYLEELGPITIGRNITEYAWDGRDMYGDRLANGVYFYRVSARIDGMNIEHRATEADRFFKQEVGKMYLLR